MKYPMSLQSKLEEIEFAISKWPIRKEFDDVIKWVLQFDPSDYDLALRVIKNLNVIGQDDLNNALSVAYSKLMRKASEKNANITARNTLFAGIGNSGKSGSMIGYHFRLLNEISEENFLNEHTIKCLEEGLVKNIVLVDDVISTGNQAVNEIADLNEKVIPLGVENIFLLTVCAMKEGINRVSSETNAHTFSAFEYGIEDTVKSLDSIFYNNVHHDERKNLKNRLEEYGGYINKSPLGYGGIGSLIVFHYNTPNSTLPIIWSDNNGWIPLFPRVRRINGILAYSKQLEISLEKQVIEKKKPNNGVSQADNNTVTLYVEGKYDELFFDILVKDFNFSNMLGYENTKIISLGGSIFSDRLIKDLLTVNKNSIFIFDDDSNEKFSVNKSKMLKEKYGDLKCVYIRPSVIALLDLKKLYRTETGMQKLLPGFETEEYIESHMIQYFEKNMLRKGSRDANDKRYKELIPLYLDQEKLKGLVNEIKNELNKNKL